MADSRLVHIVDDVPELTGLSDGPVMVLALDGFLDAGNAAMMAVGAMLSEDEGRVVASFDIDELHDYRARRPPMTFVEDHYQDYEPPRLNVRLQRDTMGSPYLLLAGPEPDIRWEAFARAVREVVQAFNVRLVVSMGAVPMAVPHTRAVGLSNHATAKRLLIQENIWDGEIRVPASAQALVEIRLGGWGHDALGFVAHIPHYVAGQDYPQASLSLLESVEDVTGLQWDHEQTETAANERAQELASQTAESDELRNVVAGLEQQYDAFHAGSGRSLLAGEEAIPSGDELGAQFEEFLAGLDDQPEEG